MGLMVYIEKHTVRRVDDDHINYVQFEELLLLACMSEGI